MVLRPLLRPLLLPLLRSPLKVNWLGQAGPPTANMAAWFRKGVGITEAASAVSAWADQSGNGRNLVQATGANQPDVTASGTILFNGSADFLKTAGFTFAQPCTICLRVKMVAWVLNDIIFDGNTAASGAVYMHPTTPNVRQYAGADATANGALVADTWASMVAVFNGASSVLQIDSTTVTGNPGTGTMGGFTLGAGAGGTAFANIEVAEAILYGAASDASKRAEYKAYLDAVIS